MQLEKILLCLDKEWIKFKASKIQGSEVIWMNKDIYQVSDCGSPSDLSDGFLARFSYGISDTVSFKNISFDLNNNKEFLAERYGGFGLAKNGGGVRCGTTAKYQLKGIGVNCLVGDHDDIVHSYGGLDAPLAVAETIYSNLFARIFPLGAVSIYGLILTGERSALDPATKQPCRGVIMVREACIRPAHFLPAHTFIPHANYRHLFKGDNARTRSINKSIARSLGSHNEYIMFLGSYLNRCANQFAFARAARIMHSTLTASNISIDGRWLDVPLSGFLTAGCNHSLSSTFYTEPVDALNFALEMLNTYSKINNVILNPAPLIKYYYEQFDAYFSLHVGFILHIPAKDISEALPVEWGMIVDAIKRIIFSAKDVDRTRAVFTLGDPIVNFIAGIYISLFNLSAGATFLARTILNHSEAYKLVVAFEKIVAFSFEKEQSPYSSSKNHITCLTLVSLKRAIFSGFYYLSEVERETRYVCIEKKIKDIGEMIEFYNLTSHWIYCENSRDSIILFKSNSMTIEYLQLKAKFKIAVKECDDKLVTFEFNTFSDMYLYIISNVNYDSFNLYSFDFLKYFKFVDEVVSFFPKHESI